jgi:nucleoside phosphorylase
VRILVTFAVEAEAAGWFRCRRFEPASDPMASALRSACIGPATAAVVVTGIGPMRARAVRAVLERERPDVCIAAGLAGALSADLARGTIVVPREIVSGEAEDADGASQRADRRLVQHAEGRGARVVPALVSTDRVLVRAADKAAWAPRAAIVDMESRRVLEAAAALGIPAAAIRAISDVADEDLPLDFNRVLTADGRVKRGALAAALISRPWRLGSLVRFGRDSVRAAAALGAFLDGYVEALSRQSAEGSRGDAEESRGGAKIAE